MEKKSTIDKNTKPVPEKHHVQNVGQLQKRNVHLFPHEDSALQQEILQAYAFKKHQSAWNCISSQ